MQDAGKVAIVPKGEYDSETAYEYLDAVTYAGSSTVYVALQGVKGVAPGSDSSIWAEWFDISDTVEQPLAEAVTAATNSAVNSAMAAANSASEAASSAQAAADTVNVAGIIIGHYKVGVTANGVPYIEEVSIDPALYEVETLAEELDAAIVTANTAADTATSQATAAANSATASATSATESAGYAAQSKEYRGGYSFGVEDEIPYLQEEEQ